MKKWLIPVTWEMFSTIVVEADTLADAIEIARDDNGDIPLPRGEYVDDSWSLAFDTEDDVRVFYNNGKED